MVVRILSLHKGKKMSPAEWNELLELPPEKKDDSFDYGGLVECVVGVLNGFNPDLPRSTLLKLTCAVSTD